MDLFVSEGECFEGMIANLWPLVRNARLVANGLVAKGLVTFGDWLDEEAGYELLLTDEGRAVIDA